VENGELARAYFERFGIAYLEKTPEEIGWQLVDKLSNYGGYEVRRRLMVTCPPNIGPGVMLEFSWIGLAHNLGIELIFSKKARTKGKIEALFRFIQRDFVLENVKLTSIKEVNEGFSEWLNNYNFSHEHEGINMQCPADLYTRSLRKLTPEELEFILVYEEARRVRKTASITYYGHFYRVPEEYIGRRVWTKLKGSTLLIECGGEIIARYTVREERYQDIPKNRL